MTLKKSTSVACVTQKSTRQRAIKARLKLQGEIQVLKDLAFLKAHVKMTPRQERLVDEAIHKASEVIAIYSDQYARAATELIASTSTASLGVD